MFFSRHIAALRLREANVVGRPRGVNVRCAGHQPAVVDERQSRSPVDYRPRARPGTRSWGPIAPAPRPPTLAALGVAVAGGPVRQFCVVATGLARAVEIQLCARVCVVFVANQGDHLHLGTAIVAELRPKLSRPRLTVGIAEIVLIRRCLRRVGGILLCGERDLVGEARPDAILFGHRNLAPCRWKRRAP